MWSVYIFKSKDKNWYYVGSTNNVGRRIEEHEMGKVQSTKHYRPFVLVFVKRFDEEKDARAYERKLKNVELRKKA